MADFCSSGFWDLATPNRAVNPNDILIGAARFFLQGYCSEATSLLEVGMWTPDMGFTLTPEMEAIDVFADQFRGSLRHVINQYGATIKFQLLRTTMDAHLFAWVSDAYTSDGTDVTSLCVTGQHREDYWRGQLICPYLKSCGIRYQREILFPKLAVSGLGDMVFKQREPLLLDLEMKVMLDFDVSGFEDTGLLFITRDRLFALV